MTDAQISNLHVQVVSRLPPIDATATATQVGDDQIDLDWIDAVGGNPFDHYEVRIDGGTVIDKGTANSHSFTGLTLGQRYTVSLRTVGPDDEGEWHDYQLVLVDDPDDNPFDDTPWMDAEPVIQGSKRWKVADYVGDGVPVPSQPEFVGPLLLSNHTLLVQDGETKQVEVGHLLLPNPPIRRVSTALQTQGSTAAAGVMMGTPRLPLDVGTYRFKCIMLTNGNATSNNGCPYPDITGGSVSKWLYTTIFQSSGGAAANGQTQNLTTATAALMEARAARAINTDPPTLANWLQTTEPYLMIVRGIVVVTSPTTIGIMVQNDVGGGNNNRLYAGSCIVARKVA